MLKDLLYTTDNQALDISRLCSLLGVLTYLGATIFIFVTTREFDPVAWGGGWTALCAGCGGWIYARQKWEVEGIKARNPAPAADPEPWGGGYGPGPSQYQRGPM